MKYWIIGVEAHGNGLRNFYIGPKRSMNEALKAGIERDMETKWCCISADNNVKLEDVQEYIATKQLLPLEVKTFADMQPFIKPFHIQADIDIPYFRKK